MKKKYHVVLTGSDRLRIEQIIQHPETSQTIKKRGKVLLMLDENQGHIQTQSKISAVCGVSDVTVWKVAKIFNECGLEETMVLHREQVRFRQPKISGEAQEKLLELACSAPPEGFSRWSVRLLARKMVELHIVESVCPDTVRLALKRCQTQSKLQNSI